MARLYGLTLSLIDPFSIFFFAMEALTDAVSNPLPLTLESTASFDTFSMSDALPVIAAPPRVHYAPARPGIQQSEGGDLSIVSFNAVDDYLSLDGADISFTLRNSGVAAADSFMVDIIYSQDEIVGNSDDHVVKRFWIEEIGAEDTLTRTVSLKKRENRLEHMKIQQGEGFLAIEVDTDNRVVETDEVNVSSVRGVGLDVINVDTQRPTYSPSVSDVSSPSFSNFTVTFSEAVGDRAAEKSSYTLSAHAGEAVEIASVDRLDDSTVRINLSSELADGQYDFAVLDEVEDLAGNAIDGTTAPFSFEIKTDDGVQYDGLPDESVLNQGGSYSTNLGLSASLALPGVAGVDVMMTEAGAIAAVNTQSGSSLHWIDPQTGAIAQSVDFTGSISDVAFDGSGKIAIASDNSLLQVDAVTGALLSELNVPSIDRVAISKDGHVGAIADRSVSLYDPSGNLLFSKTLDYRAVTDLEIRRGSTQSNVYVTSFRNDYFTDLNGKRNPVQIAKLEAFDFSGNQQWKLFGDASETIKQNVADTRLYRVTLGQDGYLYIGGESAGTATIFRWDGQPMTEAQQFGSASPVVSQIDRYSQLYNSASAHIAYYARINPLTGEMLHSQLTFPRLKSSLSNTMNIGDIAASESGTFYFGGSSFSSMLNRDSLTINGEPVGAYTSKDPTWMSISPDFRDRNFWSALSTEAAQGRVQGVDAGYGYSAAITNLDSGLFPVTQGANTGEVFISFTPEP